MLDTHVAVALYEGRTGGLGLPAKRAIDREIEEHLKKLEKAAGAALGSTDNPLLVSVRSGARDSMPGMMDTILNLGLNDETVQALVQATKNERFAWDCYRRFIQMYGDVVMGVDHEQFEHAFTKIKKKYSATEDTDVPEQGMVELVDAYKEVYRQKVGDVFPQNPFKQLELAIEAVFKS